MTWLRQLLDWQREAADPSEFLDALRLRPVQPGGVRLHPKGDVIPLPAGSTPVDFAYAVHTEVGHRCIGARVNGKLVPLESPLSNGDVVEIFTSKSETAGPSQDWLGFVKSPRARTKIRQYFNKERREEAIEAGKEAIAKTCASMGCRCSACSPPTPSSRSPGNFNLQDVAGCTRRWGRTSCPPSRWCSAWSRGYGGEEGADGGHRRGACATRPRGTQRPPTPASWSPGSRCLGQAGPLLHPGAGRHVFGFVTRTGGVSVHRDDCANATICADRPERIVEVTWKPTSASTFLVAIQVEALDRHKLLADITQALSEERVNILSATVATTRDRMAISRFTFEMADPKHLSHLLAAVRKVDGVYDAYRVTS